MRLAAKISSISWWRTPTPAIWATARSATIGATAAAHARPAACGQTDLPNGWRRDDVESKTMMPANEPANDRRRLLEGGVYLVLFGLTIPVANWLIGHAGTVCVPGGPCLIPVAPGLMAPSGVTMIGIALVLRDLVQRRLGVGVAVVAITVGATLSSMIAPPALVVASTVALLMAEFADLAVYAPLARR